MMYAIRYEECASAKLDACARDSNVFCVPWMQAYELCANPVVLTRCMCA